MNKIFTKSFEETQKLGEEFVRVIARSEATKQSKTAIVIALQGDLGGGKTTFLQGFAKGLGIKEKITSPTFVIMKRFFLPSLRATAKQSQRLSGPPSPGLPRRLRAPRNDSGFTDFYHLDCYRINKPEEILELKFKEIISDPSNIVAIEWPEKIKKYIPKTAIKIKFKFIDNNTREIMLR